MPAPAPGRVTEQTTNITIIINKVGIIILEDFSMMKCVISRKAINQITGRQGLLENCWNEVMNSPEVFPEKPLVAASRIYSSVHPATTA